MQDYDPVKSFLGEAAEEYDRDLRGDEDDAVAFLAGLAAGGPALELAIGTGRIGLPLAARGVAVEGIDLSPDMVAQLRKKPGGDDIPVTIGDFSEVPVSGTYRLIYVVYNTFFNLLEQERAGALLRERRRASRRRRSLRHRGPRPGAHQRPSREPVCRRRGDRGRRGVARRREVRPGLAAARGDARVAQRRARRAPVPDRHPLLLPERARPDGPDRGASAQGALGRVERASRSTRGASWPCPSSGGRRARRCRPQEGHEARDMAGVVEPPGLERSWGRDRQDQNAQRTCSNPPHMLRVLRHKRSPSRTCASSCSTSSSTASSTPFPSAAGACRRRAGRSGGVRRG